MSTPPPGKPRSLLQLPPDEPLNGTHYVHCLPAASNALRPPSRGWRLHIAPRFHERLYLYSNSSPSTTVHRFVVFSRRTFPPPPPPPDAALAHCPCPCPCPCPCCCRCCCCSYWRAFDPYRDCHLVPDRPRSFCQAYSRGRQEPEHLGDRSGRLPGRCPSRSDRRGWCPSCSSSPSCGACSSCACCGASCASCVACRRHGRCRHRCCCRHHCRPSGPASGRFSFWPSFPVFFFFYDIGEWRVSTRACAHACGFVPDPKSPPAPPPPPRKKRGNAIRPSTAAARPLTPRHAVDPPFFIAECSPVIPRKTAASNTLANAPLQNTSSSTINHLYAPKVLLTSHRIHIIPWLPTSNNKKDSGKKKKIVFAVITLRWRFLLDLSSPRPSSVIHAGRVAPRPLPPASTPRG